MNGNNAAGKGGNTLRAIAGVSLVTLISVAPEISQATDNIGRKITGLISRIDGEYRDWMNRKYWAWHYTHGNASAYRAEVDELIRKNAKAAARTE